MFLYLIDDSDSQHTQYPEIKLFNSTAIPCNIYNQTSFCITGSYGRSGTESFIKAQSGDTDINGEYIYDGCHNGSAYFVNINRDTPVYLYFWGDFLVDDFVSKTYPSDKWPAVIAKNVYFISTQLLKLQGLIAACDEKYLSNCSYNWEIRNPYNTQDEWELDSNVYSGNCNVLLNDPSYCNKSISFMKDGFCLSTFLNAHYEIIGCHENHPYFKNTETNTYVYYNYDFDASIIEENNELDGHFIGQGIWIISDELGNNNINNTQHVYAYCVYEDLPLCTKWFIDDILYNVDAADCSIKLSDRNAFRIKLILILPTTLFIIVAVICLYMLCKKRKQEADTTKNNAVEMQNVSKEAAETNNSNISSALQTETKQKQSSWKLWLLYPKTFMCILIMFKLLVNIYDYYTDIVLAVEWMNGYNVTFINNKVCKKVLPEDGAALLIASSIGFLFGLCSVIIPCIYEYKYNNPGKSEISTQLLTALKCLIEDVITIIITLWVGMHDLNSNLSDAFYQAYYMSVFSLFLSAFQMIAMKEHKSESKWNRITFGISLFLLIASIILSYFPLLAEMTILNVDAPIVESDPYYAAMISVNEHCYDTRYKYFDGEIEVTDSESNIQQHEFHCTGNWKVQSKAKLLICEFRHQHSMEDTNGECIFRLFAGQCVFDQCWSLPDLEVCFDILEF